MKALAEAVVLSTGTSVPAQWTRRRRWPMGRRVCEQVLEATQLKNQGIVLKAAARAAAQKGDKARLPI